MPPNKEIPELGSDERLRPQVWGYYNAMEGREEKITKAISGKEHPTKDQVEG